VIWRILELVWASVVLIGLPLTSRSLGRRLREAPADRMDLYASAALSHALLLAPTLLLDIEGDRAGIHLLLGSLPFSRFFLWTLGTVAACIAIWAAMLIEAKRHPDASDSVVLGMLPRTRREMAAFAGVSLTAGFAEELNITLQEMPLSDREQALAEQLRASQYANEAWLKRV